MLATRCPQCNTLFKVKTGQLQVHKGMVRCGQCQHVFSGIDHLTPSDSDAWAAWLANPPELALGDTHEETNQREHHTALQTETNVQTTWQPKTTLQANSRTANLNLILAWPMRAAKHCTHHWQMFDHTQKTVLCALMALCLVVLVLTQRVALASMLGLGPWVSAQPILLRMFAAAPVQVGQQPLVHIEGSGMTPVSATTLQLEISLRNAQAMPVLWPTLELDLLDAQGLLLARKTLSPNDYQRRDATGNQATASQTLPIPGYNLVEALAYVNIQTLKQQLPNTAVTGFVVRTATVSQ